MKTKTMALILVTLMSLSSFAGEEISLPSITKPDALEEGTQRQLSDAQIAELIPWAKNSKMFLKDLLDSIQGLSTEDKIERLDFGIKQVVSESAPKHSELLMRYVLNRAIVVKDILTKEMDSAAVGTADAKLRNLVASINLAIKYYEIDMNTLSKKSIPDFQIFGEDYFKFLSELNKSIFDASAQYSIQRTSLEWLQWDLYRDLNNTRHAANIIKINNALKMVPAGKQSDFQYIKNIQQLKRISQQLDILPAPVIVNNEEQPVIKVEIERSPNFDRYSYNTSSYKCYQKSATGEVMYSQVVSNSYCALPGAYVYNTSSYKCYKKSFDGQTMYADVVSNSYCVENGAYSYNTSSYKCYKKSKSGDVMYADVVSNSYCTKEGAYTYNTSSYKCYKNSNWGDVMYADVVNNNYCAQEGAYAYNSSSMKCYKKSITGDVMYTDVVSAAYCK